MPWEYLWPRQSQRNRNPNSSAETQMYFSGHFLSGVRLLVLTFSNIWTNFTQTWHNKGSLGEGDSVEMKGNTLFQGEGIMNYYEHMLVFLFFKNLIKTIYPERLKLGYKLPKVVRIQF